MGSKCWTSSKLLLVRERLSVYAVLAVCFVFLLVVYAVLVVCFDFLLVVRGMDCCLEMACMIVNS